MITRALRLFMKEIATEGCRFNYPSFIGSATTPVLPGAQKLPRKRSLTPSSRRESQQMTNGFEEELRNLQGRG